MKPCRGCPFQPESPLGLWDAAHYLLISYLGSAEVVSDRGAMGCHKYNNTLSPGLKPSQQKTCGGWVRAGRDQLPVKIAILYGRVDGADLRDRRTKVLSAEEVAERNGLDLSRLPPLRFDHTDTRYPSYQAWVDEITNLRALLAEDPSAAWEYVLPGSPLALRPDPEAVERVCGTAFTRAYGLKKE